jgi:broad specificity phosphatase PhoE
MQKEYRSLRRRPFLAPVWILAMLAAFALAVAAWAVHAASTTLVVVTRHAEKADASDDPPLSVDGLARAERLGTTFGADTAGPSVDVIFVTDRRRTAESARPLATRLGVPVITLPAADVDGLCRRIFAEYRGKRVLVIAHSNTVPQIVSRLADGGDYPALAEGDYGTTYVVAVPRWSRPSVLKLRLP